MRALFLTVLLSLPALSAADAAWPGGIAFLDLGEASGEPPVVEFDGKRVLVMNNDGRWRAAVGVPLSADLGNAAVSLPDGGTAMWMRPSKWPPLHTAVLLAWR